MRSALLISILISFTPALLAQASPQQRAIQQVLDQQVEAWNRHDLAGFMTGYWHSPQLTFFSGGEVASGWQQAFDRYKQRYLGEPGKMGRLEFSELAIQTLGPDSAFVRGHWRLATEDGKTPHGLFTLIFRKFPDGWKIVHDHTSAD